ncbi:PREDICTED: uncharacterized protein LOC109237665 [Nicotiana attenuata]|uniref:uncharacterized protein LOC109237665 n=1 Tax=Nicotiana attenuata TaxID=49451 RepID=UPI00090464E1|nr:PREDICTED: uncharacterized protein LOC109237665 [Nicotiana attenuata]
MEEDTPRLHSYKEMLLDKQDISEADYFVPEIENPMTQQKGKETTGPIILSYEDKNRLYEPWCYSIIIKLFGRRMPHYLLRSKLIELWNPFERLILIDLGWDFFIAKFGKEENLAKAIQQGPWFISGSFLSVRRWEPKFFPHEATLSLTAIWVRLPQLPTEFYAKEILEKIGRKLGKLLKIDTCTSVTLRGIYARICIRVPLESPVATSVTIGDYKQSVVYEGENILCMGCGRIGHTVKGCSHGMKQTQSTTPQDNPECPNSKPNGESNSKPDGEEEEEWKIVSFPRRRKQGPPT